MTNDEARYGEHYEPNMIYRDTNNKVVEIVYQKSMTEQEKIEYQRFCAHMAQRNKEYWYRKTIGL